MANGKVAGMIGFARQMFIGPLPKAADVDELNDRPEEPCEACREAVPCRARAMIGERIVADQSAILELH